MALSTEGCMIASASDDQCARIWRRGCLEAEHTLQHQGWVRSVRFAATAPLLVTASGDRFLRLWDLMTGECQRFSGHADGVNGAVFSPDESRIASVSGDGTLRVWDVGTGLVESVLKGHSGGVNDVAFGPGGILASASDDTTVRLWDTRTAKAAAVLSRGRGVKSLCFSARGALITTHGASVLIWDMASQGLLGSLNTPLAGAANAVAASPAGEIASATEEGVVLVWDPESQRLLSVLAGHTGGANAVAFSASGMLASGSDDATVRLWRATTQGEEPEREDMLLLLGRELDMVSDTVPDCAKGLPRGAPDWANGVSFHHLGNKVAAAFNDAKVRVWDLSSVTAAQTLCGHSGGVNSVAYAPDSGNLFSAADDGTIREWRGDAACGDLPRVLGGHSGWIRKIAFPRNGSTRLASASADGTARVWDVGTGETELELLGHSSGLRSVAFSPDACRLATASHDGTARLWDALSGSQTAKLTPHRPSAVTAIVFMPPAGDRLTSGWEDGLILSWDVRNCQVAQLFPGHSSTVRSLDASGDGAWLASASVDKTIRIWDAELGQSVNTLHGHSAAVRSVRFSPTDSRSLASASSDGSVRIWDVRTRGPVRTLPHHA